MKNRPALLFLAILLSACATPRGPQSPDKQKIAGEVRAMLADYYDAIRQEGLLAEFAFLDSSADFYWVPPGYRSPLGFDSVAAAIRRNAATLRTVDNRFDTLIVTALSDSLATYSGRLTSSFTDAAGNSSSVQLVETGVVARRATGWRLLCGQTTVVQ